MDNSSKERRVHPRIYRNFILSYQEKGNAALSHDVSQVNNLSKGGVNFSSTRPLAQGTAIIVDLKTPFLGDSIQVEGIVLECKEKISGLIYEVRLQFQAVGPDVLGVLKKIENYGETQEDI